MCVKLDIIRAPHSLILSASQHHFQLFTEEKFLTIRTIVGFANINDFELSLP